MPKGMNDASSEGVDFMSVLFQEEQGKVNNIISIKGRLELLKGAFFIILLHEEQIF